LRATRTASERTTSFGNWLRNRNTIEFLGIWEQLNNPDFNPIEFDGIKKQAGLNSFILTAKRWIESTAPIAPGVSYPLFVARRYNSFQVQ
jgi:hypothetical protein